MADKIIGFDSAKTTLICSFDLKLNFNSPSEIN
jgi:hypothetical protein